MQTVLVHGEGLRNYVVLDNVTHGMNLTVSCLADSLNFIKASAQELRVQLDGGSENNNYACYVFFGLLVHFDIFKSIDVHRLPPG
jgi:hypothetical protein